MLEVLRTPGDTSWFTHDRFGMFIHWGLYSLGARHEWLRHNEKVPTELYDSKYFSRFDPDLFDPSLWAQLAADAGMKYYVITTKHHEGFCLWDSKFTDYKAPNTPAGRDLLRPIVEAFQQKGLRTGFYYSLLDWHHPDFFIDKHLGPYREDPNIDKLNEGRDQSRYAQYMRDQVRELLTNYGPVDVMWFDYSYPKPDGTGKGHKDWESEKLYRLVRELAPKIILDDRLDMEEGWDVKTPEQYAPRSWVRHKGIPVVWEACQTFSGSWGYHRDESSWKSVEQLVQMICDTVSKGGNLLLNVGPTARGDFDQRAVDALAGIGTWMKKHSRSIYGCTAAPADIPTPQDCRLTYNPQTKRLYVHLFTWPFKYLYLDGLANRVEYAQLLNDGSELPLTTTDWTADGARQYSTDQDTLMLQLPTQKPPATVPVIELFLR